MHKISRAFWGTKMIEKNPFNQKFYNTFATPKVLFHSLFGRICFLLPESLSSLKWWFSDEFGSLLYK
ncbi:MAG: hypothetical protein C5B52_04335 [Bacteroidetes bacterium]|nr:MAG: hypothetical protein C5B52_04335 [Bacteroidota bacterium]